METSNENAKIKNSCVEFMTLKKILTRPQVEESGDMEDITEGLGSKTKLGEVCQYHCFSHLKLPIFPFYFGHAL